MRNLFTHRILTAIKRRLGLLSFHLFNPHVTLQGKGLVSRVKCKNIGEGNTIIIDAGASLTECVLFFKGNNNLLHIYSGCHLKRISFHFENDCSNIEIGKGTTMEPGCLLAAVEGKKIILGKDCMLSNDVQLRTTDSHAIFDSNGQRTNPEADIIIGNHVWIGFQSLILKGVDIPDNCIVGARSMVTASLKADKNDIIAGSPAGVLKKDHIWKRERI